LFVAPSERLPHSLVRAPTAFVGLCHDAPSSLCGFDLLAARMRGLSVSLAQLDAPEYTVLFCFTSAHGMQWFFVSLGI
jgi:hypothetical protein